jgi:hypothetical protein
MALLLVKAGDFLLGALVLGDIAGDGSAACDRAVAGAAPGATAMPRRSSPTA